MPHTRALELIEEAGLIKIFPYSHARKNAGSLLYLSGSCASYLPKIVLNISVGRYLTNIVNKRKHMSYDELIGGAIDKGCRVMHEWSKRDLPNAPFRNLLKAVWGGIEPLQINLDAFQQ